ncbi:MAG: glycosyltransferase [Mesorhizobium sp.]|uniref:glycosyltransferase family 4 protein n=1 Tax=unclassified Mesorhizobium TaxID=325217 RepID=UPI000FC9F54D|nr:MULTISPECIES: glycosyltransferase family 4 protein [unclassified Mesorhizobium]RUW37286.1 glycosyltransferase family 4 protein [Mesorhizobium sp. M2A.F.Ca.ET.015.02.1.1]RUW71962.1 glycosyltransferase family 4 protein [Mesorhizobium sp. M2A.F.Ca.ET.067.02.1.1]RVC97815.1 glycosyltransferase family 4 protein [Mesorhizobium sp. M2A.F.Ca.ET.017.03.2.1]RVD07739.1 glycosyltransferase family 4 protein [Mesorhizobium sp. M2A.F.Ca.ET.029.05.1.1]RWB46308.1 MAG: glycosyltransferase family 4 protein [Me
MRIAHVAPLYESVPPKLYGGTERIVFYITEALVELGHDVTLFASGDSETSAKLVPARDQAIRLDPRPKKSEIAAHLAMLADVRARAGEFDVIHFHLSHFLHFAFFENIAERTVTTPHGRLDYVDLAPAYKRFPRFPMISISHSQKRGLPDANWLATIHHGLPLDAYQPTYEPQAEEPYLAFLGRLSRDKRPDRAIEIARRSGLRLKLAAKIGDDDRAYFRDNIEALIDGDRIDYVGEITEDEKAEFLGNAAGLLFPIDWPEPFGLVAIEAMACGTPVIAWNNGALPEIVDDGVTGFVVDSVDAAVASIPALLDLDRWRVRAMFEKRFSVARMASDYVAAYMRLSGMPEAKAS